MTDFAVGERVYPLYAKGDTRRAGTIGGFSEYIFAPPENGREPLPASHRQGLLLISDPSPADTPGNPPRAFYVASAVSD